MCTQISSGRIQNEIVYQLYTEVTLFCHRKSLSWFITSTAGGSESLTLPRMMTQWTLILSLSFFSFELWYFLTWRLKEGFKGITPMLLEHGSVSWRGWCLTIGGFEWAPAALVCVQLNEWMPHILLPSLCTLISLIFLPPVILILPPSPLPLSTFHLPAVPSLSCLHHIHHGPGYLLQLNGCQTPTSEHAGEEYYIFNTPVLFSSPVVWSPSNLSPLCEPHLFLSLTSIETHRPAPQNLERLH